MTSNSQYSLGPQQYRLAGAIAPELCTRAALNETSNYALGLCDVAGPYPKVLARQKIAEFSTN
jgi:hypothetical protein